MENELRLSPSEWETLKAIGGWSRDRRLLDNNAVRNLVASELAIVTDSGPAITAMGRRVVVRGSPQLWNS